MEGWWFLNNQRPVTVMKDSNGYVVAYLERWAHRDSWEAWYDDKFRLE